jgi:hypothetical protein
MGAPGVTNELCLYQAVPSFFFSPLSAVAHVTQYSSDITLEYGRALRMCPSRSTCTTTRKIV